MMMVPYMFHDALLDDWFQNDWDRDFDRMMQAALLLKGKPNVTMPVPGGMVQSGGEYFLREFPTTNPNLPLDNRADGPVDNAGAADGTAIDGAADGGVEVPPMRDNSQLDSLF